MTHVIVCAIVVAMVVSLYLGLARLRRPSFWWSFGANPFRNDAQKLKDLKTGSYLTRFTEVLCYYLQWASPATWRFGPRAASHNQPQLKAEEPERAKFVDIVVFVWAIVCAVSLAFAFRPRWQLTSDIICTLAVLRVVDIVQAQVNGHLWDILRIQPREDSPATDHVNSVQRSLLLAAINYFELIGWFSAIYATFELVGGAHALGDYLYFGAITQLTIGYGDLSPLCWARTLAPLQTMLGTMLLVLGVARLVAGIRAPES